MEKRPYASFKTKWEFFNVVRNAVFFGAVLGFVIRHVKSVIYIYVHDVLSGGTRSNIGYGSWANIRHDLWERSDDVNRIGIPRYPMPHPSKPSRSPPPLFLDPWKIRDVNVTIFGGHEHSFLLTQMGVCTHPSRKGRMDATHNLSTTKRLPVDKQRYWEWKRVHLRFHVWHAGHVSFLSFWVKMLFQLPMDCAGANCPLQWHTEEDVWMWGGDG